MYDVIIAGAGPVGLFLACELRLQQASVLVLEQMADPHTPLKQMPFGMRGLWGTSLEALYRRGLLETLAAQADTNLGPGRPSPSKTSGPAGHFAGIQFDRSHIDSARWPYRLPNPADTQMMSTMENLERVLAARALELGAEIRRGQGVEHVEQSADRVLVDGLEARYLVGCDGGRSTVRKRGGFEFVGTEPELTGYSLLVELDQALPIGRHSTPSGTWTQWTPGAFAVADFDGGAGHRKPVTLEHAQALLRRMTGTDVTVTALAFSSTWTDRCKQATTYRNWRVLLAGDAAHIHSPLGGQGVNTGLGDAMNLGWKLAAALRGDDAILDTYTAERHPVGARILEWTRAQVAAMRPDPSSKALHGVLRDLIHTRDGATYIADRVWSANLRYDLGDAHPLAGRTCPDFALLDGRRVGELLRAGTWLLLDFDSKLEPLAGVSHIQSDVTDRLGLTGVLVRPDGVIAKVF